MARILYCWEVGEGFGHLLPYKRLFRALRDRGHEMLFLLKDLDNAEKALADLGVPYAQCPKRIMRGERLTIPHSYRDVLLNQGFLAPEPLLARVKGWLTLFELWRPDLIVLNHCPTGLLAARLYPARRMHLGCGFYVPPRQEPWPQYFGGRMALPERQVVAEGRALLGAVNKVLEELGGEKLEELSQFFSDTATCFTTFKELDHYPNREPVDYFGIMPMVTGGRSPVWPDGPGRKIFAYLKAGGRTEELLRTLRELNQPTLVVGPDLPGALVRRLASPRLVFSREMLDLSQAGRECDLAITHGNHGTVANLLLAGRPLLSFAKHVENFLVGEAVRRLGAGLTINAAGPEPIAPRVRELLDDEKFSKNAAAFAERYRDFNPEEALSRLIERIEGLAVVAQRCGV